MHCSSIKRKSVAKCTMCLPRNTHLKKLRLVLRGGESGSGSGSNEGKRRSSSTCRGVDMDMFHKVLSGVEENVSIDDLENRRGGSCRVSRSTKSPVGCACRTVSSSGAASPRSSWRCSTTRA